MLFFLSDPALTPPPSQTFSGRTTKKNFNTDMPKTLLYNFSSISHNSFYTRKRSPLCYSDDFGGTDPVRYKKGSGYCFSLDTRV